MSTTDELLERVSGAPSASESFQVVLSYLRERFDCDVASLHVAAAYPVTNSGPVASLGFHPGVLSAVARRWPAYLPELEPLGIAAVERRGVISDRDVYTRAEQSKKAYHRELSLAEGGLDAVVGYLQFRRKPVAALMLARRARTVVSLERDELAGLLPALSLVVAAAPGVPREWPNGVHLTRRERQVLGYASAGLTNEQIARCLDSSVNTVRNQIASLLSKLELDSRTDLARSGLDAFEPLHRR
ncbi:MAG TPA: helix-turn-helix transcriptional regulator [Polyangiaceae bacterium]